MPDAHTRPRSLRPRSTSITCSARSFGSASSSCSCWRSRTSVRRAGACPRSGAVGRSALDTDERLRRRAGELEVPKPQEEHVRAGFVTRSRGRSGSRRRRRERQAPRGHPLVDVAGPDVSLIVRDDLAVALVGHVRVRRRAGSPRPGSGSGAGRPGTRPCGEILQRRRALVVAAGGTCATRSRRCRQWSNTTARSTAISAIGGTACRRFGTGGRQELGRLVREEAHQPAGERGEVGRPAALGATRRTRPGRPAASPRRRGDRQSSVTSYIRSPSRSTTTIAAGSPATNEYRPQRSERSTVSSRMPGPVARRAPGRRRPGWRRRPAARSTPARARSPRPSVRTISDRRPAPDLLPPGPSPCERAVPYPHPSERGEEPEPFG